MWLLVVLRLVSGQCCAHFAPKRPCRHSLRMHVHVRGICDEICPLTLQLPAILRALNIHETRSCRAYAAAADTNKAAEADAEPGRSLLASFEDCSIYSLVSCAVDIGTLQAENLQGLYIVPRCCHCDSAYTRPQRGLDPGQSECLAGQPCWSCRPCLVKVKHIRAVPGWDPKGLRPPMTSRHHSLRPRICAR